MVVLSASVNALTMPLPLDRPATIVGRPFALSHTGPFEIDLQLDRGDGIESFGCLTGEEGFEALCMGRTPQLDVTWTVTEADVPVASGGTDIAGWQSRQAKIDPKDAADKLRNFRAYTAGSQEPSNQTPLYHLLGTFDGKSGHRYQVTFTVLRSAPLLAKLHPRAVVGLSAAVTKRVGPAFLGFALLCVVGGALMLLRSLSRAKTAP